MASLLKRIQKNRRKVLGLNERYLEYIRPYNLKQSIEIADDKILTKEILSKHEIPVPELLGVIKEKEDIDKIDFENLPKSFVLKPVHGVRGGGVEIFYNRDKNGNWIKGNGRQVSINGLKNICADIIDGKFSLHNERDIVMIEERVKPLKAFRYHTYKGTPDIRIIVFNNIPVMGMLRLPTEKSAGRANLDLGAIGAGIDMSVGKTTTAIYGKAGLIEKVPSTRLPVSGLRIPYWDRILEYSIRASQITKLGFAAIDFLIDKEKGPVIIELNARAGLSIQLANQTGLRARLKKASGIQIKSIKQAIRLSKDMFGGEIEEEIEALSGKQVIGIIEKCTLFALEDENVNKPVLAKIDTGAYRTSIDENLMREMGYGDVIDYFNSFAYPRIATMEEAKAIGKQRDKLIEAGKIKEHPLIKARSIVRSGTGITIRPVVNVKLELSGIMLETDATIIDRSQLSYKIIIGKKDLRRFLIDPSKK
ncbi:MAG: hypothetical protein Kow0081_3820 [Candidatus Dojkabacteria bacterium]